MQPDPYFTPATIQRIYRGLAEALVIRRVRASAVAGVAMMGGFSNIITADMVRHRLDRAPAGNR